MRYERCEKYDSEMVKQKIMGPNPIKLLEELMMQNRTPEGALVMDLGSGQGLTSVFLAREYGFRVIAADLWSDPTDNKRFFDGMGLSDREILPVKADAEALPFAHGTFDAVACTDSYNYFGRDPEYLGTKLLPFLKPGGYIYIAVPGMVKDCHDDLPEALLRSWTAEQLDYIHDADYWKAIFAATPAAQIVSLRVMESNAEVWADWLACDNEYAAGDRAAMDAGGGKYLNFISAVLRRR